MKNLTRFNLTFALIAAQTLAGQTSVPAMQFRGGAAGAPKVYVVLPNGKVFQANLGTGFTMDSSGNNWTLNYTPPTAPASTVEVSNILLKGSFNGSRTTYTVPETPAVGSLRVFINGLRATPSIDYDFNNNVITLVEGYGNFSSADNNVTIDYRK